MKFVYFLLISVFFFNNVNSQNDTINQFINTDTIKLLEGWVIGIDPGHGKIVKQFKLDSLDFNYDVGGIPNNYYDLRYESESYYVLEIAKKLQVLLEEEGAVVVFSDRKNYNAATYPQTIQRLKPLTDANVDFFISLHFESYIYDNNRTEVFFNYRNRNSIILSKSILKSFIDSLSTYPELNYRSDVSRIIYDDELNVLTNTYLTCCLVELINLQIDRSAEFMRKSENIDLMAFLLFKGIVEYVKSKEILLD